MGNLSHIRGNYCGWKGDDEKKFEHSLQYGGGEEGGHTEFPAIPAKNT